MVKISDIHNNIYPAISYINYTHYEEFNEAYKLALNTEETSKMFDFFDEIGMTFMRKIYEHLDFKPMEDVQPPTTKDMENLANVMKDLYTVTDFKKIKEFQAKKLESSPAYKEFYELFHSRKTRVLFEKFFHNRKVEKFFRTLKKHGIPAFRYTVFLYRFSFFLF